MKIRKWSAAAAIVIAACLLGGLALSQTAREARGKGAAILKQVLTPRQLRALAQFAKAHREERKEGIEKALEQSEDLEGLVRKFDLTPEQEEELARLGAGRLGQIVPAAEPIMAGESALREALLAETPDEQAIRAASAELARGIGEAVVIAAGAGKEALAVLTPEQIALLDDLRRKSGDDEQEALAKLPQGVDSLLAFYRDVDVSPEQIDGLIKLSGPLEKIFKDQGELRETVFLLKLQAILADPQMQTLMAYHDEQKRAGEARAEEQKQKVLKLWNELGISKSQMDALEALVEARKSEIIPAAESIIEASWLLRDDALAPNPDAARIRDDANSLGDVIGDAAVLGADMIAEARKILSPQQFALVVEFTLAAEAEAHEAVRQAPGEIRKLLDLRAKLDLTPEQRDAVKQLILSEMQKQQRELKRMEAVAGPLF